MKIAEMRENRAHLLDALQKLEKFGTGLNDSDQMILGVLSKKWLSNTEEPLSVKEIHLDDLLKSGKKGSKKLVNWTEEGRFILFIQKVDGIGNQIGSQAVMSSQVAKQLNNRKIQLNGQDIVHVEVLDGKNYYETLARIGEIFIAEIAANDAAKDHVKDHGSSGKTHSGARSNLAFMPETGLKALTMYKKIVSIFTSSSNKIIHGIAKRWEEAIKRVLERNKEDSEKKAEEKYYQIKDQILEKEINKQQTNERQINEQQIKTNEIRQ